MTVRTRNRLIALSIIAAPFVFLLGLLLFWDAEPLPPVPPLPNPNGYEALVKAGEMITTKVEFTELKNLSQEELHILVSKNLEALQIARTGLQQESRVPLDYSSTSTRVLIRQSSLLHLAFAFEAEGKLAEMENHTNDTIRSYLDLIRLGNESSRGGVIIDQLVGIAIESLGTEQLQKLVDQLDAKSCREIGAALKTLDSQRQTWDEVMQQERDWSRRTFPGIRYELVRLMGRNSMQKIDQHAEQEFDKRRSETRQLIIELAARAYELDKGHRPASVADLVPDYLKAIPQDPFTGTNMVYSP